MGGKRIGYIRVSTIDQKTDRQLDGIQVDKVFVDHASGKDTNRPQLQAALDYLREGDVLLVHSMDRLARNVEDLRRTVREVTSKGVTVQFMKENLNFTGDDDAPLNTLMLTMLGAFAEFERSLIRERQREGIALAKARGDVYKGRKPALNDEQIRELLARVEAGAKKAVVAREFGISRETLYSYLGKSTSAS